MEEKKEKKKVTVSQWDSFYWSQLRLEYIVFKMKRTQGQVIITVKRNTRIPSNALLNASLQSIPTPITKSSVTRVYVFSTCPLWIILMSLWLSESEKKIEYCNRHKLFSLVAPFHDLQIDHVKFLTNTTENKSLDVGKMMKVTT